MDDSHVNVATHTRDFPLTHPDVVQLVSELERIEATAMREASEAIDRFKRSGDALKYSPSRLAKSRRLQEVLMTQYSAFHREAMIKRLPQLRRLNLRIWKICPEWQWKTDVDFLTMAPGPLFGLGLSGRAPKQ